MGNYQYILKCAFNIKPKRCVRIEDELEITIPCINCQRNNRTIIFENTNEQGICTPQKKCSGFRGKLTSREVIKKRKSVEVNYLIDFQYEPFMDQKLGTSSNFEFGWARVHFTLKCPRCSKKHNISTQENMVRPWQKRCKCGKIIYKELENPFLYEVKKID